MKITEQKIMSKTEKLSQQSLRGSDVIDRRRWGCGYFKDVTKDEHAQQIHITYCLELQLTQFNLIFFKYTVIEAIKKSLFKKYINSLNDLKFAIMFKTHNKSFTFDWKFTSALPYWVFVCLKRKAKQLFPQSWTRGSIFFPPNNFQKPHLISALSGVVRLFCIFISQPGRLYQLSVLKFAWNIS